MEQRWTQRTSRAIEGVNIIPTDGPFTAASLDAAAAAELFCNSPATITQSVKYDTAINIDIEKTSIGILSMSYEFIGYRG